MIENMKFDYNIGILIILLVVLLDHIDRWYIMRCNRRKSETLHVEKVDESPYADPYDFPHILITAPEEIKFKFKDIEVTTDVIRDDGKTYYRYRLFDKDEFNQRNNSL